MSDLDVKVLEGFLRPHSGNTGEVLVVGLDGRASAIFAPDHVDPVDLNRYAQLMGSPRLGRQAPFSVPVYDDVKLVHRFDGITDPAGILKVDAGASLLIRLPGHAMSGCTWTAASADESVLHLTGSDYEAIPGLDSLGVEVFTLEARQPGSTTVKAIESRSGGTAFNEALFLVTVR